MRLRHPVSGVQLLVPNSKVDRLTAQGYAPVPDAEQPPAGTGEPRPTTAQDDQPAMTSIAAALRQAVGPTWDYTG